VTVEAALLGTPMVTFYKVDSRKLDVGPHAGAGAFLFDGELNRGARGGPRADAIE
jgi:hypothetical protein